MLMRRVSVAVIVGAMVALVLPASPAEANVTRTRSCTVDANRKATVTMVAGAANGNTLYSTVKMTGGSPSLNTQQIAHQTDGSGYYIWYWVSGQVRNNGLTYVMTNTRGWPVGHHDPFYWDYYWELVWPNGDRCFTNWFGWIPHSPCPPWCAIPE
jgi:hypothetical protein